MSDLRDRIADALYTAPAVPTEAGERVARRTAEHDADAVMGVVGPEIAHWRTEATDGAVMAKRRGELVRELKDTLAGVRALHTNSHTARGTGRFHPDPPDHWTPYCDHCDQDWPCDTIRTIDGSAEEAPVDDG